MPFPIVPVYDPCMSKPLFADEFLTPSNWAIYRDSIMKTAQVLQDAFPFGPHSGKSPTELAELIDSEFLPRNSATLDEALQKARSIIAHSVAVNDPNTIAHLHCPPLI